MLRIAVCDDDAHQLKQVTKLLQDYFQSHPFQTAEVSTFLHGRTLLDEIRAKSGFDLYILDILMPEWNGIALGQTLRKNGDSGQIIYLTNSNDFAADSYDVQAFYYLLKPVEPQKLFSVLDGIVEVQYRQEKQQAILVQTTEGPLRLFLNQIRYVERVGRLMRYHCTDGMLDSQTIRVPFKEMVAPLLADQRFFLCGASYVLNFQHVKGHHTHGHRSLPSNRVYTEQATSCFI